MKTKTKLLLCMLGIFLSTQIGWIIKEAEIFNGIGLIFGIGLGWYASQLKIEGKK